MEPFDEKRKHERFSLTLPCMLSMDDDSVIVDSYESRTNNLSAGGALLVTSNETRIHGSVTLDMIIPPQIIKCDNSSGTCITARGSVVRSSNREVVVAFREDYRIAPLDQVLRFIRRKIAWIEEYKSRTQSNDHERIVLFGENKNGQKNDLICLEKF